MYAVLSTLFHLAPAFRRWSWKLRRAVRNLKDFVVDLLIIVISVGFLVGVWYVAFCLWPHWSGKW